jgi:hypothetical protein
MTVAGVVMSPLCANGTTRLTRTLPLLGTLIPSIPLTAVLVLPGCANSPGPTSPSAALATAAISVQNEKGTGHDTIDQTYTVWGGRPEGYLTGAILTITTSVGTASYVASGPHARVKADVPVTDTLVHIVITYPNFCFEQDVPVLTAKSPGPNSVTPLYPSHC